jgi:hypothetical protein
MKQLRIILGLLIVLASVAQAKKQKLYDVEFFDVGVEDRCLMVSFYGTAPEACVIDRILRESLEHAGLVDGSKNIQGVVCLDDESMPSKNFSGGRNYNAKAKKVVTYEEDKELRGTNK